MRFLLSSRSRIDKQPLIADVAGQQETIVIFMKAKEIAHKNMPEKFIIEVNHKRGYDRYTSVPQWIIDAMEEYAEMQRNEAFREATKIAYENFKHGEFTVTNKILKNVTDYPEVPFNWPTKK